MDKVLVFRDLKRADQLRDTVAEVADRCNELTDLFNAFQPWQRITSVAEFEQLVADPAAYFDAVIIENVKITAAGRSVNAAAAADLFDVDREAFLNIAAGVPVNNPECKPCAKLRMKPGQRIITANTYNSYSELLEFVDGLFSPDFAALEREVLKYDLYAETDQQREVVEHFDGLCSILNEHKMRYGLKQSKEIATALHLHLTRGTEGDFMPDVSFIGNQVIALKQQGK